MWTLTTRAQNNRKSLRYQTDLTDEEWAGHCHIKPVKGSLSRFLSAAEGPKPLISLVAAMRDKARSEVKEGSRDGVDAPCSPASMCHSVVVD